jgi:ubiquinone/menaquinone biosynthesis C-methylase UbiE
MRHDDAVTAVFVGLRIMSDLKPPSTASVLEYGARDYSSYLDIAPAGGDTATPLNLAKRLDVIERYAPIRGRRVLDCGCGAGDYVGALRRRGAQAWGVEFSQDKLATAPRSVVGCISAGDLHDIAFQDATVDVALLNEVLEHVPNDGRAVREVYRVLKPGGTLVIFSPNRRYPFETHGTYLKGSGRRVPHYVPLIPYVPLPLATKVIDFWARNYWPGELRRLVMSAGFRITATDYVWQTFEGISNHQPALIARTKGLLRVLSRWLEHMPLVRTLGVSQVIVACKPLRSHQ